MYITYYMCQFITFYTQNHYFSTRIVTYACRLSRWMPVTGYSRWFYVIKYKLYLYSVIYKCSTRLFRLVYRPLVSQRPMPSLPQCILRYTVRPSLTYPLTSPFQGHAASSPAIAASSFYQGRPRTSLEISATGYASMHSAYS